MSKAKITCPTCGAEPRVFFERFDFLGRFGIEHAASVECDGCGNYLFIPIDADYAEMMSKYWEVEYGDA